MSASALPGSSPSARSSPDPPAVHRVGVVADPGAPWALVEHIAPGLAEHLVERLGPETRWEVHTRQASLAVAAEDGMLLEGPARDLAQEHGWDTLIAVVDLPRFVDGRGVVADVLPVTRLVAICVPALGVAAPRRRLRETIVRMLEHLDEAGEPPSDGELDVENADTEGVAPHGQGAGGDRGDDGLHADPALTALTPLNDTLGAIGPAPSRDSEDRHTATVFVKGWTGTLRLLAGMVMANRPLGLLKDMSWSIASAAAAGAYGVFYGSIWTLSSVMSTARLTLVSLLAWALLVGWLIITNGLWVRDRTRRRRSALDNISTLVTVGIPCAVVYLGLFAGLAVAAAVIIPQEYLSQQLHADAGLVSFLKLTWLATSMGTMAGAVGSNFDDTESIRTATYSLRELDRRRRGEAAQEKESHSPADARE